MARFFAPSIEYFLFLFCVVSLKAKVRVMSRIGRKPVAVPDGVQINFAAGQVTVKGPKGQLVQSINSGISVKSENGHVVLERSGDSKPLRSLHGLYRALIANMIVGVTKGYERTLRIVGTGYRVELKGKDLEVTAGFCHPVKFPAPEGIIFEIPKSNSRDYMDFIVKGIACINSLAGDFLDFFNVFLNVFGCVCQAH